jgi:hypothetical protein
MFFHGRMNILAGWLPDFEVRPPERVLPSIQPGRGKEEPLTSGERGEKTFKIPYYRKGLKGSLVAKGMRIIEDYRGTKTFKNISVSLTR